MVHYLTVLLVSVSLLLGNTRSAERSGVQVALSGVKWRVVVFLMYNVEPDDTPEPVGIS